MRYRIKEPNRSVMIKISANARHDQAIIARRAITAVRRCPKARVIFHLVGWQEIPIPELGFVEIIRREINTQGGSLRLCGFGDDLWIQCDRNRSLRRSYHPSDDLDDGLLEIQDLPLKRSA